MTISRRRILSAGATLGAYAMVRSTNAFALDTPTAPPPDIEVRSLDELYSAAIAEGGKLVVYAGGDVPDGNVATENAFKARFPEIDVRIITDLSKYHDTRIDQQIARGRLECDVAHLQTMHDYDRWKAADLIEPYKPLGWDAVYPEFKDPDGAFTAIRIFSFSNVVAADLPEDETPRDAPDYLDPRHKGKLVLTYPHDDDAVLFQFDRIVSTYGWDFVDRLMAQDVQWIRGTVPASRVVQAGEKVATFTASGALAPTQTSRFLLPRNDTFLTWPQMAAIFRASPHKEAARLYLSWMLDKATIEASPFQRVVRRDVANPAGFDPVFAYNTDPTAFRRFMADRGRIERLKGQFEHLIGPATGDNPTQAKGLYLVDT
ncbi:ABC transporter substrate-binding protein [Mesorhizobium xinjiangense]|uniref:ABC transporter substrate-binding protein n=1 Tax=Mesorhizobium xinjiangense TaxID=2678685 RepID=UPI0012EE23AE|nr:ABC transporter substrate-binding protein [Mesorhizobium xinjiangense]